VGINAKEQGGLTFVETVAVLLLFSLLLVAAVPNLFPASVAADVAARELVADMGLARQLAVSRGEAHLVEFSPPGGPFTRYTVRRAPGPDEPGFPKDLPGGVTASGPASVTFLSSGAAQLPTAWVEWRLDSRTENARVRLWAQTGYARALP